MQKQKIIIDGLIPEEYKADTRVYTHCLFYADVDGYDIITDSEGNVLYAFEHKVHDDDDDDDLDELLGIKPSIDDDDIPW